MPYAYDIAAVVSGARSDDGVEGRLRLFGCQPEVVTRRGLTVIVNRERGANPGRAMAAFMRHLENAQVKFDYITVGGAENALSDYARDMLGEDGPTPAFA
jgi:hypothetical protein